ncbi:MAG: hypothetical protein ABL933_07080 [Methyloglobulus sp.]
MIVFKSLLTMPHLHQGRDHALGFAVGLGSVDFGELLADALLLAGFDEGMIVGALILLAIVGVSVIDLVRALGDDVIHQELGGAALGLVRQDVGVQLPGEVVDYPQGTRATNRYSLGCVGVWPLSNGRRLVKRATIFRES